MRGYLFVLFSAFIYGIEPSLRVLALQDGASATGIMLLTSVVFFAISSVVCALRRQSLRLSWQSILQLIIAGGLGVCLTGLLLTLSYRSVPVGCATVIHFMYPTIVSVAMACILKKRLTPVKIAVVILSFVGMVCISGDSFSGSFGGILLALGSSVTFATYIILLDRGRPAFAAQNAKLFYIAVGAAGFSLLLYLLGSRAETWSVTGFVSVASCGVLSYLACFCFTCGIKRIGASAASFCSLFEPVTSLVVSAVLFLYVFTVKSIVGCLLSFLAILLICMENHRESLRMQAPEALEE